MKRSSSPSLQFLASAESSTGAATMSSRPPYRGGRNQWRRGFSGGSSGGGNGNGRGQFLTGDSHFRSVRDANRGFQPVEGGNFANQSPLQPQPRPPFNPRYPPHFYAPPPFNPGQPFSHPPPFNQNLHFRPPQQFRPRPQKRSDYRNWEFAKPGPPPHCERFTVLSYNILADYLAINHRSKLYFHIPRHMLEWEWRKKNIIFELGLWSADILCFQEVDRFEDLEEELKLRGYSGIWKMRTGDPVDGCAIFWRVSRFKLLHEECIEFNRLGLRDNVAQICVLESLNQTDNKDISALPMSLTGSNKVVICNIHVLYNPKRGEIKLGQIRVLLNRAHAISKLWNDAPVVLCGDFNCTPKSPIYNYVSEQKLNLSELPRDKVSGQASAEIRPLRQFSPNFRAQSADSPGGASTVLDHREVRPSSPLSDMQEQNNPGSNSVNVPLMISQVNTGMNVSDNSFISGQFGNKNGALSHELTKESHEKVDGCKAETLSALSVTVSGLKESPSSSQDKGRFLVEQMTDGHESITEDSHHEDSYSSLVETGLTKDTHQDTVDGLTESATGPQNEGGFSVVESKDGHKFTAVDSCHEDIYPNLIETEHGESLHGTSDAQRDSSSEHSQPNLETQDESMNCDKSELSFLGAKYSADTLIDPKPAGAPNSHVSSSELSNETSFPSTLKVSAMGSSEKLSSLLVADDKDIRSTLSEVNVSYASTRFDFTIDEKMENLSFNELVDTNEEDRSFGEDCTQFLSELHDTNGSFSSDFTHTVRSDFVESDKSFEGSAVPHSQQLHHPADEILDNDSPGMDSELIDAVTFSYDPSAWTPMEIETATGNGDCTLMEHSLKLRSTYAEVEDFSGTRDSNGEPLVTSYNRCFLGTVDYIWRSEGLRTVKILAPIPKHAMQWTPGFPTKKWGSDHIALVSELAFTKDVRIQNTETS